jgi:uncharacterized protein
MAKIIFDEKVAGGYGKSVHIVKGQYLTIIDLEGKQIVDFLAFAADDITKYMSVSHTRSTYDTYDLTTGDYMYTVNHEPMIQIVEDTCGVHDMSFPCCNQYMFKNPGMESHRSCQENFTESLSEYGVEGYMIPDPFHFFQNSPNMKLLPNHSKPGDYVKLKFLMDAVVAVSACPYDIKGINGGTPSSIQLTITEES